jgi:hypothetical protein
MRPEQAKYTPGRSPNPSPSILHPDQEPARCDRILATQKHGDKSESEIDKMPRFVIEREIPEVGKWSQEQLHAVSQTSCGVLREMGTQIQWVQSYVTDDKIYCVYIAPDEDSVRKHAQMGGFPANKVSQVRAVIDPTTSE